MFLGLQNTRSPIDADTALFKFKFKNKREKGIYGLKTIINPTIWLFISL